MNCFLEEALENARETGIEIIRQALRKFHDAFGDKQFTRELVEIADRRRARGCNRSEVLDVLLIASDMWPSNYLISNAAERLRVRILVDAADTFPDREGFYSVCDPELACMLENDSIGGC